MRVSYGVSSVIFKVWSMFYCVVSVLYEKLVTFDCIITRPVCIFFMDFKLQKEFMKYLVISINVMTESPGAPFTNMV